MTLAVYIDNNRAFLEYAHLDFAALSDSNIVLFQGLFILHFIDAYAGPESYDRIGVYVDGFVV